METVTAGASIMNDSQLTDKVKPVTPLQNAAIGGFAGALEVLINQPSVAFKNALQSGRALPRPSEWYRGVVINCSSIAPITSIQFAGNGIFTSMLSNGGKRDRDDVEVVGVAAMAGATSATVSTPAEMIMIQQQQTGRALMSTAKSIVNQYGITRLYKGFAPTLMRESVFTGCYLGLASVLANQLEGTALFEGKPTLSQISGSIGAGLVAALISQPADTIKTRMQSVVEKGGNSPYSTVKATVETIRNENGGLRLLWRGLAPRGLRIISAVFVLGESGRRLTSLFHEYDILA